MGSYRVSVLIKGPLVKVKGPSRHLLQVTRKEIHQASLRSSPPCPEGTASPLVSLTIVFCCSMTGIPGSPPWWWMLCLGSWEVRGVGWVGAKEHAVLFSCHLLPLLRASLLSSSCLGSF